MHRIVSHLIVATVLAGHHISDMHSLAAARLASAPASAIGLVVVVLVIALVAMMTMAARGMTTLISEFLRVAASLTSVMFAMVIAVIVAVVLITRH